ncbi:MAG TPA: undecaprenyl-phosphate glucose phosphotransferase, partial [Pararhizobium sp.]|nr:undecaprenyl-phosphate glucose phosphotransferase [Pararhizobium sp.]
MNGIDPAHRFSADAVVKLLRGDEKPVELNESARHLAAQYRHDTMSPAIVTGTVRIAEFVLLSLLGGVICCIYPGALTQAVWQYPAALFAASLLAIVLLQLSDCYKMPALMRPSSIFLRVVLSWAVTFAVAALAGFLLNAMGYSWRMLFGLWFAVGMLSIFSLRLIMARPIRRWARNGRIERRTVIVGGGEAAEQLIRTVEKQPYNDIRICGIFDDRKDRRSPPVVAGYPRLGTVSELIEFARIARIDMLIVSLPITAEMRVLQL